MWLGMAPQINYLLAVASAVQGFRACVFIARVWGHVVLLQGFRAFGIIATAGLRSIFWLKKMSILQPPSKHSSICVRSSIPWDKRGDIIFTK
jgi:hypothetical protein